MFLQLDAAVPGGRPRFRPGRGALGALVGIGGIASALVQVPGGSGGDRWGRRPFFVVAMVLLACSQMARWQASQPAFLLVAQILGGAAQGIATVNAWALFADATQSNLGTQGRVFRILNASLAVGLVAAARSVVAARYSVWTSFCTPASADDRTADSLPSDADSVSRQPRP